MSGAEEEGKHSSVTCLQTERTEKKEYKNANGFNACYVRTVYICDRPETMSC